MKKIKYFCYELSDSAAESRLPAWVASLCWGLGQCIFTATGVQDISGRAGRGTTVTSSTELFFDICTSRYMKGEVESVCFVE